MSRPTPVVATVIASDALAARYNLSGSGVPSSSIDSFRDYICDGVADDEEIQAAIDSLPSGGGKVLLSEGTFNIAASIVPADNVILEGMGDSTLLQAAAGLDDNVIGTPSSGNLSEAQFVNFRVDGNRNNNASGSGIFLYGARYCRIENVVVETCDDHGIHFQGPAAPDQGFYNWVTRCHVNLCDGDGIRIEGTEFTWITENIVRFITGDGIYADVTNDQIKDNILDSITGDSIHVEFGAGKWTITGNDIDRPGGAAIMMRRNDFGIVSYNRIDNLETNQIGIGNGESDTASDNGDNLTVSHNQIGIKSGETGTVGINESRQSVNCIYKDNQLVGLATAMSLHASSTGGKVSGNVGHVTENSGTGSIVNTATTDVITHGLDVTPTAANISITLTENPTNTPGAIWVDTITSTQFTVNCENDPGASNLDFSWQAVVL